MGELTRPQSAIGKVKTVAVCSRNVNLIIPALFEPGYSCEIKIRAECAEQAGQKEHVVTRTIIPIGHAFDTGAIGRVETHRHRNVFDARVENFIGEFRFFIGYDERAHAESAVADLVPIVVTARPPGVFAIAF